MEERTRQGEQRQSGAAPGRWLSIGEFGRRSGLSHKALRLYELSGLLPPAAVDPVNGYRRYTVDQVERARRISVLRQLEMPLAAVAEVLAGSDDEALRRLDLWWAEQESRMRARRGAFEYLRTQLIETGQPAVTYPVHTREVAAATVAAIRREVDQAALVPTMTECGERIRRHLRDAGAEATGEMWWVYHGLVTPDSEAPVEVCVPFTGRVDPAGEIVIRVEPAHTQAYCTITRDECYFPRIMRAYDAVAAWALHAGWSPAGPGREIYFADWSTTAGGEPFAHVAQPVERGLPQPVARSLP
jgi:DNA-binding transcriptional MerR regulator